MFSRFRNGQTGPTASVSIGQVDDDARRLAEGAHRTLALPCPGQRAIPYSRLVLASVATGNVPQL